MNTQTWKLMTVAVMFATIAGLMFGVPAAVNSEPSAGATKVRDTDGATMVYVPSGEFLMGSPQGEGNSDEWPQHTVYLDGFWIDRTEVTNRQFEMFVTATGYRTETENEGTGAVYSASATKDPAIVAGANWQHPEGAESGIAERLDVPVVQVTWHDAVAYCQWAGGRLPTEAEWEKAAGGPDGRRYPWGNERPTCQNVAMRCGHEWKALPVGSKPAGTSSYGGVDMLCNVAEWVSDVYARDYYRYSANINPAGPDTGMDRIIRGSWWPDHLRYFSRTWRHPVTAGFRSNSSGFRCVMPTRTSLTPSFTTSATPVTPSPAAPPIPVRIGHHDYAFEWNGEQLNYLLYLPKDYESDMQKRWPLILFLHGSGEKGNTLKSLSGLRYNVLQGKIEYKSDFPFIVLSPQLSTYALDWYGALDLIDALLDQIVVSYRVDTARLSVMGPSMGGEGTWLMVTRKRPDRFAAAVPIAGASAYYLDQSNACLPKDVAFWVFHGDQDKTIPISNSEALVKALRCNTPCFQIWGTIYGAKCTMSRCTTGCFSSADRTSELRRECVRKEHHY